ncbi:MAG: glycosyltransferase family 39 protein [Planctomycetia bacterium]|nr:glycosyltransferase family 39 protein [Planctomycetia bacterium]
MSGRGFAFILVALFPAYLALAAVLPPLDDELYYWCWSQRLQLSYYDHPPMVAYMIRASTDLFGSSIFAVRLPAVCASLVVLAVIGWLMRPRHLLPLVICSPIFTLGAVLVTPDSPLLMFWALYVAWLVKVQEQANPAREGGGWRKTHRPRGRGSSGMWLVGGVILGCGILGKYTMALAVVAGFVSFVLGGNWRRWVAGYVLHLVVAVAVASPILIHNIKHDFLPLSYQWGHSMGSPEPGLAPFAKFVGVQVLLFGLLPLAVFVWTLCNWRELIRDPRLRVCACLFALPFGFFLLKSTRGPLEGNWALVCFIAVWPLAARWYESVRDSARRRWATRVSFAAPIGCVVFLAVHLVRPLEVVPVAGDRLSRQESKLELARELSACLARDVDSTPVFVPTYQWAALLRWHNVEAEQLAGITRPSHFTQRPTSPSAFERVYVFTDRVIPNEHLPGFGPPRRIKEFPVTVRGQPYGKFVLLEYARQQK